MRKDNQINHTKTNLDILRMGEEKVQLETDSKNDNYSESNASSVSLVTRVDEKDRINSDIEDAIAEKHQGHTLNDNNMLNMPQVIPPQYVQNFVPFQYLQQQMYQGYGNYEYNRVLQNQAFPNGYYDQGPYVSSTMPAMVRNQVREDINQNGESASLSTATTTTTANTTSKSSNTIGASKDKSAFTNVNSEMSTSFESSTSSNSNRNGENNHAEANLQPNLNYAMNAYAAQPTMQPGYAYYFSQNPMLQHPGYSTQQLETDSKNDNYSESNASSVSLVTRVDEKDRIKDIL